MDGEHNVSNNGRSASARRSHSLPTVTMRALAIGHREWTAVEKYKLKGLAERGLPTQKIAKALKRSAAISRAMASRLGIRLIDAPPPPTS